MSQFGLGEGVAQSAASGGEGVLYVLGKEGGRKDINLGHSGVDKWLPS